jgi:F-type H+-transporting ATPase subunit delta
MRSGLVQIQHEEADTEFEKYFVSGGFSLSHGNSVTDISALEAVKVEDLDETAVKDGLAKYQTDFNTASEGTLEKAEAQIALETHQEMARALGIAL